MYRVYVQVKHNTILIKQSIFCSNTVKIREKRGVLGLTSVYLSIKIPKLYVLAGSERMDKELTIAHMQGMFRMIVVNNVGHIIHEDNHRKMSEIVKDFVKVFRITSCLSEIREIWK